MVRPVVREYTRTALKELLGRFAVLVGSMPAARAIESIVEDEFEERKEHAGTHEKE